jgi:hypothetical protein
MTLQHDDEDAVDRFTASVDEALIRGAAGRQNAAIRLIGMWMAAGAILTLAVLADDALSTILYILGIALVVVSLASLLRRVAPGPLGAG